MMSLVNKTAVWLNLRLYWFLLFFVARSLVAAVDGKHTLSSSASRCTSRANRDLIHEDREFSRCSARIRNAVARVATSQGQTCSCSQFLVIFSCFWFVLFQVVFLGRRPEMEAWRTKIELEANFASWNAYGCCPPLGGLVVAIMVTRSREFSLALAVLHTFDMASLALQLCCFFFLGGGFLVQVLWLHCGRRRETQFVFVNVAPQIACKQTSHAQIATSPLHARSSARNQRGVARVATKKCQTGGFCRSSIAKRLLARWSYFFVVFLWFFFCLKLFLFLIFCLVAAVDRARGVGTFREDGMEASSKRTSLTNKTRRNDGRWTLI